MRISGYWLLEKHLNWPGPPRFTRFPSSRTSANLYRFRQHGEEDPLESWNNDPRRPAAAQLTRHHFYGWTGLRADDLNKDSPVNIYAVDYVSHDWLFPKVKQSCITAAPVLSVQFSSAGKPMTIIPFFADQAFWGESIGVSWRSY